MKGMGKNIKSRKITHKGKSHEYIYIEDATGILQLVQMGTIEFHGWQSTLAHKGKPDQIIFDLDPDPTVPFEAVKLAAEDIRVRLASRKLASFARLSGGKGIHVVVPIRPEHDWGKVKDYARSFAEEMAREAPEAYVANMSKARRKGKIFIDFFRNDFASTAIVPFSLRARAGAPLAWPVSWSDLKKIKQAQEMQLTNINKRDFIKAEKAVQEWLQFKAPSLRI